MSDGQETNIKKEKYTLEEGEEEKEGDGKGFKIQSKAIPQTVTQIDVYFTTDVDYILSLVMHGQEGDLLWAGPT